MNNLFPHPVSFRASAHSVWAGTLLAALLLALPTARATTMMSFVTEDLLNGTSGSFFSGPVSGSFSFDEALVTGAGLEAVPLIDFSFTDHLGRTSTLSGGGFVAGFDIGAEHLNGVFTGLYGGARQTPFSSSAFSPEVELFFDFLDPHLTYISWGIQGRAGKSTNVASFTVLGAAPEPATAALLALGLTGAGFAGRRKTREG